MHYAVLLAFFLLLAGCGGGASTVAKESVTYTPPPTPSYALVFPSGSLPQSVTVNSVQTWRTSGYNGNGVRVAVLDNGFAASSELTNVIASSAQQYTVQSGQLVNTNSGVTKNPNQDHGIWMSTIIAGQTYGVAPGVSLINGCISTATDGSASFSSIVGGLNWAVNQQYADIVNLSFSSSGIAKLTSSAGSSDYVSTMNAGFNGLYNLNRLLVMSAGNNNENLTTTIAAQESSGNFTHLVHDANISKQVLIAGALNTDGTLASYAATTGSDASIQNRTLFAVGRIQISPTTYVIGSSASTAVVSGVASLMKQRWNYLGGKEISQIMLDTANRSFSGYDAAIYGMGKLDAVKAFSPVGYTSVSSLGSLQSVSPSALSVTLPAGIQAQSLTYSAFDTYGRDFSYQLKASHFPATLFSESLASFANLGKVAYKQEGMIYGIDHYYGKQQLRDGLWLSSGMSQRGYEPIGGMAFLGFSNMASRYGIDSLYRTGIGFNASASRQINVGLLYGEKQGVDNVMQSSGAYLSMKEGRFHTVMSSMLSPPVVKTDSILSANEGIGFATDTRYEADHIMTGIKLDLVQYTGNLALQSSELFSKTAYFGVKSKVVAHDWQFGALFSHRQATGYLDVNLPVGKSDNGEVIFQNQRAQLTGDDNSVALTAQYSLKQSVISLLALNSSIDSGVIMNYNLSW